jgi:prephenate dehydrogenase
MPGTGAKGPDGTPRIERVGLAGYGRFGRAFGALLLDAGFEVRAFDPADPAEGDRAAGSPAELAAWADALVLAVPVAAMRSALLEFRPALRPNQLVLDAGSVKTAPVQWMSEILGGDIPWIGTHPLFGPTSIALGERPLRVVLCPNALHPAALAAAADLYARAGCHALVRDPETHDRAMAESHALSYFIAKALLDAGVDLDTELSPPSARGLERTVDSVRSDAGHLFTTVHRENPFAAEVRRRFLDALLESDAALRDGTPDSAGPLAANGRPALEIPDLGTRSPALRETRELIDEVDRDILALLARRAELARRARAAKAGIGHGVRDTRREEDLLADRKAWAAGLDLDPVSVEGVFDAILRFSRRLQAREKAGVPPGEERS